MSFFGDPTALTHIEVSQIPEHHRQIVSHITDANGKIHLESLMNEFEIHKNQQLDHIDVSQLSDELKGKLSEFDQDGDNHISISELVSALEHLHGERRKSARMRKYLWILAGIFSLFLLATFGLQFGAIELSKESKVDSDDGIAGAMRDLSGNMIVTETPKVYTTLLDIPRLPPVALHSIKELTFTTTDEVVHTYSVFGTKLSASSDVFYVLFQYGSRLKLNTTAATGVLEVVDPYSGSTTDYPVILETYSRRLSSLLDLHKAGGGNDLLNRCTNDGFCYHTFEEMLSMGNIPSSSASGRRLQTANPEGGAGMAQIDADIKVLLEGHSTLSAASDFINSFFDGIEEGGTTTLSFIMEERCLNYDDLADQCRNTPAPSEGDGFGTVAPWPGLGSRQGGWYFRDEIEYSKDPHTIQMKVRYAQDPLRENRKWVIMMDRDPDSSRVLTYEEVVTVKNPVNPAIELLEATTFITNFELSDTVPDDMEGGFMIEGDGLRRLSEKMEGFDYRFHRHIRKHHIKGFPDITIPERILRTPTHDSSGQKLMENEDFRRKLQEDDGIDDDADRETIEIDTSATKSHTVGQVELDRLDDDLKEAYAGLNETYKSVPGQIINTTFEGDGVPDDTSEPETYFLEPELVTVATNLVWPRWTENVDVEEFLDVPIISRDLLAFEYEGVKNDTSAGADDRRRLRESSRRLREQELTDKQKTHVDKRQARYNKRARKLKEGIADFKDAVKMLTGITQAANKAQTVKKQERKSRSVSALRKLSTSPRLTFKQKVSGWIDSEEDGMKYDLIKEAALTSAQISNAGMQSGPSDGWYSYTPRLNCALMSESVNDFNDNMQTILYDNQMRLNDAGELTLEGLEIAESFSTALGLIERVRDAMKLVIPILQNIPYIGFVLKTFYNMISRMITLTVSQVKNAIDPLLDKIESKDVEGKIEDVMIANTLLAEMLMVVVGQTHLTHYVTVADATCPNQVGVTTQGICSDVEPLFSDINTELEKIIVPIQSFVTFLDEKMRPAFEQAAAFLSTSVWNAFEPVLEGVDSVLTIVEGFLSTVFSATFPWICWTTQQFCTLIWYPCGVAWCKSCGWWCIWWPCGVHWCNFQACVWLPVPYVCEIGVSVSVMQILDGILSALSFAADAITWLVSQAAEALGIEFPTITLPGLPSGAVFSEIKEKLDQIFDVSPITDEIKAAVESLQNELADKLPTLPNPCV